MLVWLSWQSSSLVMSRSCVRIASQAPDPAFGGVFILPKKHFNIYPPGYVEMKK